MRTAAAIVVLAACSVQDVKELGGGTGLDLPYLDVVYQCDVRDITVDHRGESYTDSQYEFCYPGSATELAQRIVAAWGVALARCQPTPRHLGPCVACCSDDCAIHAANAFNGTWCE